MSRRIQEGGATRPAPRPDGRSAWRQALETDPSNRCLSLVTGHRVAHQDAPSFNEAMLHWLDGLAESPHR